MRPRLDPRKLSPVLLAFLIAVGGPAACGDDQERAVRRGGTAVIVATAGLDALNPLVTGSVYAQEATRHLLFMPLLRFGPELELEPWLAESWALDGDTAAVLRLRDDIVWQDSVPTTAYDAAFTLARALDPETGYPSAGNFARWTDVRALDSLTLRISFEPHPEPLAGLPLLPILPAHVLDTVPAAAMRTTAFNREPVANGPFRLAEARPGDRWVFERNPDFPAALGGPPSLDRLVWRVVPEAQAQVAELLTGNAHLALEPPAERFDSLAARDDLIGVEKPSFRYSFIGWNGRRPPLDAAAVRVAFTRAIDRPEILAAARQGHGRVALGPVPPTHWAFADTLEPLAYDPQAAIDTLEALGFRQRDDDPPREDPAGTELAFELMVPAGNDASRDLALMVQADLAEVGVQLAIRPLEFGTLVQTITGPERDFDAVLLALDADIRLDLASLFHSRALNGPFQIAGYRNARLDSLLDVVETELARDRTRPLWHQIQALLVREQPWTFLYYYPDLILYDDGLQGVNMDLRGVLRSAPDWWLADPEG
ncbi:MAG: ABC transporter substrate-binding protein [Candidatus Longimicrobiales bacterium M2_2A_002]